MPTFIDTRAAVFEPSFKNVTTRTDGRTFGRFYKSSREMWLKISNMPWIMLRTLHTVG